MAEANRFIRFGRV
ncbi:MAG TPA: hypothetical protein DC054_17395 [Blastocatellia bacterium]|nr:hypothetical protein [Blastocatellia bacterium]